MDELFNQLANISKAGAYDILVEQVGELKKENAKLREALSNLISGYEKRHGLLNTEGLHEEFHAAKEAMKVTKYSNQ